MKKIFFVAAMIFITVALFASGISEEDIRQEYASKGFPNRDAWLYEFNSVANNLVRYSESITSGTSWSLSNDKYLFDGACARYKVLLDMGVELGYINDNTRRQQITRAEDERRKVAQYLASQSSGLGLE